MLFLTFTLCNVLSSSKRTPACHLILTKTQRTYECCQRDIVTCRQYSPHSVCVTVRIPLSLHFFNRYILLWPARKKLVAESMSGTVWFCALGHDLLSRVCLDLPNGWWSRNRGVRIIIWLTECAGIYSLHYLYRSRDILLLGICVKDGVPCRAGILRPFHIQPLNEILQFEHTTNNFFFCL